LIRWRGDACRPIGDPETRIGSIDSPRPREYVMFLAPLAMLGANSCTRTAGYLKTQGLRQAHLKHVKGTGQPGYAGSCFLTEARTLLLRDPTASGRCAYLLFIFPWSATEFKHQKQENKARKRNTWSSGPELLFLGTSRRLTQLTSSTCASLNMRPESD